MYACLDGPIRRFGGEPTLSGGSRLPLIAERCLVILQGSVSSKILIFACEEDLSHLKQITIAVLCAISDSEVEEL